MSKPANTPFAVQSDPSDPSDLSDSSDPSDPSDSSGNPRPGRPFGEVREEKFGVLLAL